VEKRYLTNEKTQREYHLRLANYFESVQNSIERKSDELPWHLFMLQDWYRLKTCLSEWDIFLKLNHKAKKYELKGYWLAMPQFDIAETYTEAIQRIESLNPPKDQLATGYRKLGRFLREMIKYEAAEPIMIKACNLNEQLFGSRNINTAKCYYLLAELYWNQSKWDQAQPWCQLSLDIRKELLGPDHPDVAMSLMGLGEMEMRKPGHGDARSMIENALRIRIAKFGTEHPLVSRCLQDLAVIEDNSGNSEKAIRLCNQALKIREKVTLIKVI